MLYINYSWRLAIINIFMFIIMLLIAHPWRTYYNPQRNNVHKGIFSFFLLYIFTCVFAFWSSDTYHSWNGFIIDSNYGELGYEKVYDYFLYLSGNNYFFWRTLVWVPACLFLFLCAKRLKLLHRNMLLAMILFGAMLSYTRGMLGHAMLLWGIVLLLDKNSDIATKIVGLFFFTVSYYFHKSMFVNIAFAILAFYPLNKKSFIISLVVFPFLTVVASMLIHNIIAGSLDVSFGEGAAGERAVLYAAGEQLDNTTRLAIGNIIMVIPEYLVLLYLINRVLYKNYFSGIKNEKVFLYLFRLTYISIYVATLFTFVDTSVWIYKRFKYMAFFPLPFVLAKVWSLESRSNLWIKCIILMQLLALFCGWFSLIKYYYGI